MAYNAPMTIYYDMSAAVHAHPGLGRYADSLGRALLQAHGESMSLFYYGKAGIRPPRRMSQGWRISSARPR